MRVKDKDKSEAAMVNVPWCHDCDQPLGLCKCEDAMTNQPALDAKAMEAAKEAFVGAGQNSDRYQDASYYFGNLEDAIIAYRASLLQQTAEPVAWRWRESAGDAWVVQEASTLPDGVQFQPLYTHPASPPVGGAVKVKALEWKKRDPSGGIWRAETILGAYRVWIHAEAQSRWFWSGGVGKEGSASTVDAAKAAAQADYEQRVLAALEPRASDRERTIEECAKVANEALTTILAQLPKHINLSSEALSAVAAIRKLSEVSHEH